MSNIEHLGGPLDHLSEKGLKQLVRDLQQRLYDTEFERDRLKAELKLLMQDHGKCFQERDKALSHLAVAREATQKSLLEAADKIEASVNIKGLSETSESLINCHFQSRHDAKICRDLAQKLSERGGESK